MRLEASGGWPPKSKAKPTDDTRLKPGAAVPEAAAESKKRR
jgi:hypothetical protein